MAPNRGARVFGSMKTTQAINFFVVGLGMCFGPAFWPQAFARGLVDASALWLLLVGAMQVLLGAVVLGCNEVPRMVRWLRDWEPVKFDFAPADVRWVLSEAFYSGMQAEEEITVAFTLQKQLRLGQG